MCVCVCVSIQPSFKSGQDILGPPAGFSYKVDTAADEVNDRPAATKSPRQLRLSASQSAVRVMLLDFDSAFKH